MKRMSIGLLPFLFTLSALANPPARDGLFATLETTSGDICIELLFEDAPRTVANFVTLAEGTRSWFDTETNGVSNAPYYNGRTFHRVIENFVIQTGLQVNFPGPGYAFNDEFSPNARHDTEGVVSMANSGPDSNGSQFFITLRALPGLDFDQPPAGSQHAVFGRVVTGMEVVRAISTVATDTNDVPLQPITLETVTIVRQGPAASAFNALAVQPALPTVRGTRLTLQRINGSFQLSWNAQANSRIWLSGATDLTTWSLFSSSIVGSGVNITGTVAANDEGQFAIVEVITNE